MEQRFVLNPSYTGPLLVADYLRKMKSDTSLVRMIKSFNKRYFVLDLNHMVFYYLPEKGSHFTNSTDIQLTSIVGIKAGKQVHMVDGDKVWKYEFIILLKNKMLKLISVSEKTMENFLYAFSHVIDRKTNKPLYDWNQYMAPSQSQSQSPQLYKFQDEPTPLGLNDSELDSAEGLMKVLETKKPEKDQRTQKGTSLNTEITIIKGLNKQGIMQETKESNSQDQSSTESKSPQSSEGSSNKSSPSKKDSLAFRKQGGTKPLRGKGIEVVSQDNNRLLSLGDAWNKVSDKKEIQTTDFRVNEETGQNYARSINRVHTVGQNSLGRREAFQAKPKMSFDVAEKEDSETEDGDIFNKKTVPVGNDQRRTMQRNYTVASMNQVRADSFGTGNSNSEESENGFVGLNQVDLSQYKKKGTQKSHFVTGTQYQPRSYGDKKIQSGNNMAFSFPEIGDLTLKHDSPLANINIMAGSKKPAPTFCNDNDWDTEMFKDNGSNILSLKKVDRLNSNGHGGRQSPLKRQTVHNDWDDEL